MQKALTDTLIRAIRAPDTGRLEIGDIKCAGLTFRVTSKGARSWCFRFTDPDTRRDARLTIGNYPDIKLGKARQLADGYRGAVARGENPVASRRRAREGAKAATFAHLAGRYLVEHARRKKKSHAVDERNLTLHVLPHWRTRAYATISRADVVELLERIITAGKPTLCNRVQALVSKIFSFAIDSGLMTTSPCYRLARRGVETVGERVLSDDEIRLFWSRIGDRSSFGTGRALRLALLTGARVGEVAGMCRAELEHIEDAERSAWRLPGERTKNGRPHVIPLSPAARQIVLDLLGQLDTSERYLFPARPRGDQRGHRPIAGQTLSNRILQFGYAVEGEDEAAKAWRADAPSAHDLRRTFATRMAALGVPKEIRDRLLNHSPDTRDTEAKYYNAYAFLPEKRRALLEWDSALFAILSDRPGSVVPIGAARKVAR